LSVRLWIECHTRDRRRREARGPVSHRGARGGRPAGAARPYLADGGALSGTSRRGWVARAPGGARSISPA